MLLIVLTAMLLLLPIVSADLSVISATPVPASTNSQGAGNFSGFFFTFNTSLPINAIGINVTQITAKIANIVQASRLSTCRLNTSVAGTPIIATANIDNNTLICTFTSNLSSLNFSREHMLTAGNTTASATHYFTSGASYPQISPLINLTAGSNNGNRQSGNVWDFSQINITFNYIYPDFLIYAYNVYTNGTVSNYTALITFQNGTTLLFSTTTGVINTSLRGLNEAVNVSINSTQDGGYFQRNVVAQNLTAPLNASLTQSVVSFLATQFITNVSLTGFNFSTQYITNTTHYMAQNNYTVNATKTNYFSKSQNISITALSNTSITIENITDTRLNLTLRSQITGNLITNSTIMFVNSNFSYSRNFTSQTGNFQLDALVGTWSLFIDAPGFAYTSNITNLSAGTNNLTIYVYTSESINITFRDETSNALITPTNVTVDFISSAFSFNRSTTTGWVYVDLLSPTNYTIRYRGTGYGERFSYFEVTTRSSSNLTLYMLNTTVEANITITVVDETSNRVAGALVRILKYDLASNSYIQRESIITDYAGQVITGVVLNTEYYKFVVEYPIGDQVLITEPSYITSLTPRLQINTGTQTIQIDRYLGVTSTLDYNPATANFRAEITDNGNYLDYACIQVYRTIANQSRTNYSTVCSDDDLSITILAPIDNTSVALYRADLYYKFSDKNSLNYVRTKSVDFRGATNWGIFGVVVVIFLTIFVIILTKDSVPMMLVTAPLPLVVFSAISFIAIPLYVSLPIYFLCLIGAYFVSRYQQ